MKPLLDRIAANLANLPGGLEDVPSARRRLRQIRDQLRRHEAARERDRLWWRLRAIEEQLHMLLLDYASALPLAANILAQPSGPDLRERVLVEADVLRCCIETQPLELTRQSMEWIFAQTYYADHGLAGHLAHIACGLLAERRGNTALAEEFFQKAWKTWSEEWCEPISVVEILTRCASYAARRHAAAPLAIWTAKIATHHRGYLCDEFRLRFTRLLALGLQSLSLNLAAEIHREAAGAFELLKTIPERAHFSDYTLALLYLLARTGAVELATEWDCLLPNRRRFERRLWLADRAWFEASEAQNLPPPTLTPYPLEIPPFCDTPMNAPPPRSARPRLIAAYLAVESSAQAEDSRLQCTWRQTIVGDRLQVLADNS